MTWVRLWKEMPNDPKWRVVKSRALQNVSFVSIGQIVSVFVHMLANADKNGNLENWCDEDIAAALEYDVDIVSAIRVAMQGKVLDGNHLKSWDKRQPNGGDYSTERVRAFRGRRKQNETLGNARNDQKRRESDTDIGDSSLRSESKNKKPVGFLQKKQKPAKNSIEKKGKTELADDSQPDEADLAFAADSGLDSRNAADEWAQFRDHHLKNQSRFADWHAAWRNWVRNWGKTRRPAARPNGHDPPANLEPQIFIEEETPQWIAWNEYTRKLKGFREGRTAVPKTDHKTDHGYVTGWYFPTEWPPTEPSE